MYSWADGVSTVEYGLHSGFPCSLERLTIPFFALRTAPIRVISGEMDANAVAERHQHHGLFVPLPYSRAGMLSRLSVDPAESLSLRTFSNRIIMSVVTDGITGDLTMSLPRSSANLACFKKLIT